MTDRYRLRLEIENKKQLYMRKVEKRGAKFLTHYSAPKFVVLSDQL